jgi:heat shock transcription factor
MSDEQNSRVQSLQERLQPLSPSGQIPGLGEGATGEYFGEPGPYDLDLDSFVQNQDYFPGNEAAGAGLPDFNFDNPTPDLTGAAFDFGNAPDAETHLGVDDAANGGFAESVSSNGSHGASPATVEEVEDETRRERRRKK